MATYHLKTIMDHANECTVQIDRKWVPKRPDNHRFEPLADKISSAWKVLMGKADAVVWPLNQ